MFQASIPALVTPFRDGRVDEKSFGDFIEWQIAQGSSALVPCGTTGETATLSIEEHNRAIQFTVDVARGRVPVIAGCGSNDTATALVHMRHAEKAGAQAGLVVVPYYNRPGQEGIYQHYAHLAQNSDLPIVVYNVPARTVADISVETLARLREFKTIIGIKDATGNLARVSAQRAACGTDFCQLSGNDDMALGFMAMGGAGCISVSANVAPALCAQAIAACMAGDYAKALQMQDKLFPLHAALFSDPSPGPTKYALSRLGRMAPDVRLPITEPSPASRAAVDAALAHAGVL